MLKRTMTAVLAITLMVTAGSAMAQCVIGVYADAAGTQSTIEPILFAEFDVFVVLRNESSVAGASYEIVAPLFTQLDYQGSYGPDGLGLNIRTPGGENVGFASCVSGFGGIPVLVATYSTLVFDTAAVGGLYEVIANPDENPLNPVMATCNDLLLDCGNTQPLQVTGVIATESTSFGAVKSLY